MRKLLAVILGLSAFVATFAGEKLFHSKIAPIYVADGGSSPFPPPHRPVS